MGALLIPVAMSSLRGLTHVLTCQNLDKSSFTMLIPPEGGQVSLLSSTRVERDEVEAGLCDGLFLDMAARITEDGEVVQMEVPITNRSEFDWKGTVKLVLNGTSIPVDIGEIKSGETAVDTVDFSLDEGTFELQGSLLIGP